MYQGEVRNNRLEEGRLESGHLEGGGGRRGERGDKGL